MKRFLLAVVWTAALPLCGQTVAPASNPAPVHAAQKTQGVDFGPDLARVTNDLKQKFAAPPESRTNFEENLQAIHALVMQHLKDGNREQLARLYLLDAHIYADGLTNSAKASAIWRETIRDYPGTLAAQGAAISLSRVMAQAAAEDLSIPEGLELGQRFPNFTEPEIGGSMLSSAAYRGKVTLVDFWATWCGPCKAEMPNVIATYQKYHALGFDIIGVSLDSERNNVIAYTQAAGMPWAQYFDGKGWDNKLAQSYGIHSIPMAYLLDKHGVIIGKGLRGAALAAAVAQSLAKE